MSQTYVGSSSANWGGASTGTSATLTVPAGVQTGDLAIVIGQVMSPGDADTIVSPAGWAAITGASFHQTASDVTGDRWQVFAASHYIQGDSGSWVFTWANTAVYRFAVEVIRGVAPTAPIDAASTTGTTYAGSLPTASQTWPGVTTTGTLEMVLLVAFNDQAATYSAVTGWSNRFANSGALFDDRSFSSAGATGSVTTVASKPADQTLTLVALSSTVAAPVNQSLPILTDTSNANRWQTGDTISTTNGQWTNSPSSYLYQWQRDTTDISGQTGGTYLLAAADVGHTVRAVVTAVNAGGSTSATSASSGTVIAAASAPVNTLLPTISGSPAQGQPLTADAGTWQNSPTSFIYQWQRDLSNVGTASSSTLYTAAAEDVGHQMSVQVIASNAGGSGTATSAQTAKVLPAGGSVGAPVMGDTLHSSTGGWTGTPSLFAYQWLRNSSPISLATTANYVMVAADVGHTLSVNVIATNSFGDSTPQTSGATGPVVTIPLNVAAPTISGTATVGSTLLASPGTWSGIPSAFSYQWRRGGVNIIGGIASSYVLQAADRGATITVTVWAVNAAGYAVATSLSTGTIA